MQETAALTLVSPSAASAPLRIPRRPLKIAGAAALLWAGAYGILSEQANIASSDAVVSAYVLDIRTPSEGTLTHLIRTPGTPVAAGELLAHLEDPLADHQHLDNLRTLYQTAQSTADADSAELLALTAQRNRLLTRAASHSAAVATRLTHTVAEAEANQSAARLSAQLATQQLDRGRQLHTAGIISHADYALLVSGEGVARQRLEAARIELRSLEGQQLTATHGLLSEPGTNNDVAYSRQRADELDFKITETERSLAASRAEAQQAKAAVEVEATRAAHLAATDVRSPIAGQIFQVQAIDGERTGTGDPIVSLIDCTHQFLLVEVPQDRLPDIALGGTARYRLAGEAAEATGTVLSATGSGAANDTLQTHKFAAYPLLDSAEQRATVRVALDPATPCTAGRTARVLLPTRPTNRLSRTLQQYF